MNPKKSTVKRARRTSTRKNNHKLEEVSNAPSKLQKSPISQILIIVGIAVVIILGIMLYRFGTVGKAYQEAPSPLAFNLDVDGEEYINVDTLHSGKLMLTLSDAKKSQEYTFELTKNKDGSLVYELSGLGYARELITETVGGGEVYFSGDEVADLFVSYSAPYFYIKNLNFKEPEDVKINLLDESFAEISTPFVSVTPATKIVLLFNATSSNKPDLSIMWANGTQFTPEELTENATGDLFVTKRLEWTPTIAGANVLSVTGKIGEKETTKRYVIAAGNIVYELNEKNLPKMIVKKAEKGTAAEVTLTFSDKAMMQPFSLPCGSVDLKSEAVPPEMQDKIDVISSYYPYYYQENPIYQWVKGVPSNFQILEANKGYFIQRKAGVVGDIILSVACGASATAPPEMIPTFNQPSLEAGWNLIGISGYEPIKVEKLTRPAYKKITLVYSIDNEGADTTTSFITELLPGRAYWVRVE